MSSEAEVLERWFTTADANHDGRIDGNEALNFFQRSNLPRPTLKEIWMMTVNSQSFMTKQQFYGAMRLVSLAQISGGVFVPRQAQQVLTGTAPPTPLPKMAGLTSETWSPSPSMSPTYTATTQMQPPAVQLTGGSLQTGPALQVTGHVPMQYTGGRPDVAFPPLPMEQAMSYGTFFQSLDNDGDGFLQGSQCIELFSSRGVDRNVLKQIWHVVAGNAGKVNRDQFVKCLYLIETTRQGIPIPANLPQGPFPPIVQTTPSATAAVQPSYGAGEFPNLPARAVFQPQETAAYPGWRGPAANESMISTLDPSQRDRIMAERVEAQKKDQELYLMDKEAETAKNKREFYDKALQELMIFKSRMEVAKIDVQDKLAREQHSVEEVEQRYEQIRLGAEEATREAGSLTSRMQEAQQRKTELETKLSEIQQSLAMRERSHPELIHQLEAEIQILQESVSSLELRRNTLAAELESYEHQRNILTRRQVDLQMSRVAAEAEVHSASSDIEKLLSQVETANDANDAEQIQKLLRDASRVYSNLYSHACKAGVEIPVEARLKLYGNEISWQDDLISAGFDVSGWQEDGFVLVDAFPDMRDDMDAEFEKAIQNAVHNIKLMETEKAAITKPVEVAAGGGEDPFGAIAGGGTQPSNFTTFDAFLAVELPQAATPPPTAAATFAVNFDTAGTPPPSTPPPTAGTEFGFGAFDDPVAPSSKPDGFEPSPGFVDFPATFPPPQITGPPAPAHNTDDFFGDTAFPRADSS